MNLTKLLIFKVFTIPFHYKRYILSCPWNWSIWNHVNGKMKLVLPYWDYSVHCSSVWVLKILWLGYHHIQFFSREPLYFISLRCDSEVIPVIPVLNIESQKDCYKITTNLECWRYDTLSQTNIVIDWFH